MGLLIGPQPDCFGQKIGENTIFLDHTYCRKASAAKIVLTFTKSKKSAPLDCTLSVVRD